MKELISDPARISRALAKQAVDAAYVSMNNALVNSSLNGRDYDLLEASEMVKYYQRLLSTNGSRYNRLSLDRCLAEYRDLKDGSQRIDDDQADDVEDYDWLGEFDDDIPI